MLREKRLSDTSEDSRAMASLASEADTVVRIGFTTARFSTAVAVTAVSSSWTSA